MYALVYFWVSILLHWSMHMFYANEYCFNYYGFIIEFGIRNMVPSALFVCLFFSKLRWVFSVFCCSIYFFLMICSIFVNNNIRILINISLNSYITLKSMDILAILTLLIHEHRVFFHLCLLWFLSLLSLQNTGISPPL